MAITILQFDTSTPVCTVALSQDGETLGQSAADGKNVHAASLTTQIAELLEKHRIRFQDLSAVAVGKGPGSYTGLRIGVSTAKGICYAADIPLIAIDSLRILAEGFHLTQDSSQAVETLLCPMIDARRMEVYMSVFTSEREVIRPTAAEIIDEHAFDFLQSGQQIYLFGSGADKLATLFQHHHRVQVIGNIQTDASAMSSLAFQAYTQQDFVDLAYFEPFYLKDFIPTTPKKQV